MEKKAVILEDGQWEIRTDTPFNLIETFDTKDYAKRSFGKIKKEIINSEDDGAVYLYWRENENDKWKLMQRFIIGEDSLSSDLESMLGKERSFR